MARTREAAELGDMAKAMIMNRWQRITMSGGTALGLVLVAFSSPALGADPAAAQVERAGGVVVQVAGCGDGSGGVLREQTSPTGHHGSMRMV